MFSTFERDCLSLTLPVERFVIGDTNEVSGGNGGIEPHRDQVTSRTPDCATLPCTGALLAPITPMKETCSRGASRWKAPAKGELEVSRLPSALDC